MKFQPISRKLASALALVAATVITAVPAVRSQNRAIIKIDGSSTVYPITEAVAEEFQIAKRGRVWVTVGISGTGGGFKKFCNGQTDISDASRPIKESEKLKCQAAGIDYIELPVAYDAITVVVNPQNNWANSITVAELEKIWSGASQGKITTWNQVRSGWPNTTFTLFAPGADSGTFDYFNEAIVGKGNDSRTDYTPSEDDNVLVQGVARDRNAVGYFGFAYYKANKNRLKAVAIDPGNGKPVLPSTETVKSGSYKPLSRRIFIYVNVKAASRPEVKEFVEYYLKNASLFAEEVGYIPLRASEYVLDIQRFHEMLENR